MTHRRRFSQFFDVLPNSWSFERFGDLLEGIRNGLYKSKEFHGRGQKVINMGELFAYDFISDQEMKRVELTTEEIEKHVVKDGDLLFARRSLVLEGSGKCSLVVSPPEDTVIESSLIRARLLQSEACPKFYYYLFHSPQGRALMASISKRTAVSGITGSDLIELIVPRPPLADQISIASILSAYDDLIENNTRRIKILEEMAQTIYREWFVEFRAPGVELRKATPEEQKVTGNEVFPKGWSVGRLGAVCDIVMGQSPKSEHYNETGEGLPFHQGVSDFGARFPTDRIFSTIGSRIAERGDVLFSVRAPVGRLNLSTKKIILGRGLSAIRSRTGHQSFIFQLLKQVFHKEDMLGGGTIFKSVTKEDMHDIQLITPEDGIVIRFEEHCVPMFRLLECFTLKNANLRRTRDLLLPKLISGEVDVENLNIAC